MSLIKTHTSYPFLALMPFADIPISSNALVHAFRTDRARVTLDYIQERGEAIRAAKELAQIKQECELKGEPCPEVHPAPAPPAVPETCPITKEMFESLNQEIQEPPCDNEKAELQWIRTAKPLIDSIPLPHLTTWAAQIKEKGLTKDLFLRAAHDTPQVAASYFLSQVDSAILKTFRQMMPHFEDAVALFQPPHAVVYVALSSRHFVWTVLFATPRPNKLRGKIMYENEKKEHVLCGMVIDDAPRTDEFLHQFLQLMKSRAFRGYIMEMLFSYKTNKKYKKTRPNARLFITVPEDCLFNAPIQKMARLNFLPHFKTQEAKETAQSLPGLAAAIKASQFHKHKRVVVLLYGVQCNLYTVLNAYDLDQPTLHYVGFLRRQDTVTGEVTNEPKDFED